MMIESQLEGALSLLGELLKNREQSADISLIGGGALLLIGAIARPTKDLDVVAFSDDGELRPAEPFPEFLARAVTEVASALELPSDWLNPGPTDLLRFGLPEGFLQRTIVRSYGGLTIRLAALQDQVFFKLYTAVDQGPRSRHFADLQLLEPGPGQLLAAARWCRSHDPSDGFRLMLVQTLAALGLETADV